MVMTHGDNQGLVLPPRVASVQVIVIPCGITAKTADEERDGIYAACESLAGTLKKAGIRARADVRDGYTPGWKFNEWEQKGVPLRLEIGPVDLKKDQALGVRRDTGAKAPLALEGVCESVRTLLETIQQNLLSKAKEVYDSKYAFIFWHIVPKKKTFYYRLKVVTNWEDVVPTLDEKNVVVLPWCEVIECEDNIKERSKG